MIALLLTGALALPSCARSQRAAIAPRADGPGETIPVELVRPEGPGPFPAVVLLHSCAGLGRGARHAGDWIRRLVAMGYAVALPDSFTTRGYPDGVCGNGLLVPPEVRAADAYAAVRYLEANPDIASDRIGTIGYSHGGWTVLAALDRGVAEWARSAAGAQHGFAAGVAFYPECGYGAWLAAYRTTAPLLILAGEIDDWTLSAPCQSLADRASSQGQPVSIKIYAGARHSFDTYLPPTRVPEARRGRGATIGGDAAARQDSIEQTRAFFARYLEPAVTPPNSPLPR